MWVTGAGTTGVWVWVLDNATCTLTHYPHSGKGICRGVLSCNYCTVLLIYQTLPTKSHFQHHRLYQAVIIKMADKAERESSSIYRNKPSIKSKMEKLEFEYLTCSSKKGTTGQSRTIQQPTHSNYLHTKA